MKEVAKIFVPADTLKRELHVDSFGSISSSEYHLPYDTLAHAEQLLEPNASEHIRIDAISNLKRAIFLRNDQLNKKYNFKRLPFFKKDVGFFERLSGLGLIKPLMLAQLIEIRRQVEHCFSAPPSVNRCREFSEFTWYYLRSTDPLLYHEIETFGYGDGVDEKIGKERWVSFSVNPKNNWQINNFRGWFALDEVSETATPNSLFILDATVTSYIEGAARSPGWINEERKLDHSDVFIEGVSLICPDHHFEKIISDYFQLVLNGY